MQQDDSYDSPLAPTLQQGVQAEGVPQGKVAGRTYWGQASIPLTRGKAALIDASDYAIVSQYSWWCSASGYAMTTVKKPVPRKIYLHRLILDAPEGLLTDHVNRNPLDNRRENLRICTHAQNVWNSKPASGGTSRYKGVSWDKKSLRWKAAIRVDGVKIELGHFLGEHRAALAYNAAAKRHYGEFAFLNRVPKNLRDQIGPYRPPRNNS